MSGLKKGDLAITLGIRDPDHLDCNGRVVEITSGLVMSRAAKTKELGYQFKWVGEIPPSSRGYQCFWARPCFLRKIGGPSVDTTERTDRSIPVKGDHEVLT